MNKTLALSALMIATNGAIYSTDCAIDFKLTTLGVTCFGGHDGQIEVTDVTGGQCPPTLKTFVLGLFYTPCVPHYLYKIDDSQFGIDSKFIGLTGGEHTITVKDETGCTASKTVFLPEPGRLEITKLCIKPAECRDIHNGKVRVEEVQGGTEPYQYTVTRFKDLDCAFKHLKKGTYSVIVRDANGCEVQKIIEVPVEKHENSTADQDEDNDDQEDEA